VLHFELEIKKYAVSRRIYCLKCYLFSSENDLKMRIYELLNEQGKPRAFEVSNLFLTRNRACQIAASVTGAKVSKRSRVFRDSDDFCEFNIGDETFIIEEPYGDNSRFWIGPKTQSASHALPAIRAKFENHNQWKSPISVIFIGSLIMTIYLYFTG
jgi:hypothetical protein